MLGLTQQQFADLLGVTSQQFHKYERGINSVSAGRLYEIAGASDTSIAYFFEGLEKIEGAPLGQSQLLEIMRSLGEVRDARHLEVISQLVRALADH